MKSLYDRVRPYLILVSLLLLVGSNAGCAAVNLPSNYQPMLTNQAVSIQMGTVLYGIKQCIADKPGTMILVRDNQYLFVWFYESVGAGMFGVDVSKGSFNIMNMLSNGGAFTNAASAFDLTTWMGKNGWSVVSGASIAEAARVTILASIEGVTLLTLYIVVPSESGFPEWQNIPNLGDSEDNQS